VGAPVLHRQNGGVTSSNPSFNIHRMAQPSTNTEFLEALKGLIDGWCERRSLRPLARVLSPYLSFNGMTDGWSELAIALKSIRALDSEQISPKERGIVDDLIRATDIAVHGR
jgi:hypothetical protein